MSNNSLKNSIHEASGVFGRFYLDRAIVTRFWFEIFLQEPWPNLVPGTKPKEESVENESRNQKTRGAS